MAGPGVPITELMVSQNEMVLQSAGIEKAAIDAYLPLYKDIMQACIIANDKPAAIAKANELTKVWFDKTDKNFVKATTNITSEADIQKFATAMAETLSTNWWKYFAAYHPQPVLRKLTCPVLAMNGSADIQVPATANLKGIEAGLTKAGNKQFVIKQFDGLNHLFQKCSKCTVAEYGELATTIEPEVLNFMGDWLDKALAK
jgi:pimeloyl-ACP methyl ester carboxylesterase